MAHFLPTSEIAGLVAGALAVSAIHAVLPNHWIPFVVVGRAQGWSRRRTTGLLLIAATGHLVVTLLLGCVVAWVGAEVVHRVEGVTHLVTSGTLLAVGGLYLGLGLAGRGGHGPGHHVPDRVAVGGLVASLALSPCESLVPLFLAASPHGWQTVIFLGVVTSVATVAGMLVLTLLAWRGTERFHFHWLEDHERTVMGAVLVAVGVLAAVLPHVNVG